MRPEKGVSTTVLASSLKAIWPIACFVERAPCLPWRMCSISSRTNSPACVDGDLPARFASHGWHVQSCNGHDLAALQSAIARAKAETARPSVIIADTVKGRGVSFMQDDTNWHYRSRNAEELGRALKELGLR
mgnify:CR=1 FL=1